VNFPNSGSASIHPVIRKPSLALYDHIHTSCVTVKLPQHYNKIAEEMVGITYRSIPRNAKKAAGNPNEMPAAFLLSCD
jgi:hypothetical protein